MLKPLHDYVLLELLLDETKTAGGIIIPDNAKEKPSRGHVVAVGNSAELTVKPGDTVMFLQYAPTANEIKLDGKSFIILKEKDILGVL